MHKWIIRCPLPSGIFRFRCTSFERHQTRSPALHKKSLAGANLSSPLWQLTRRTIFPPASSWEASINWSEAKLHFPLVQAVLVRQHDREGEGLIMWFLHFARHSRKKGSELCFTKENWASANLTTTGQMLSWNGELSLFSRLKSHGPTSSQATD